MKPKSVKLIVTCPSCGEEPDRCTYCGKPIAFALSKKEVKNLAKGFKQHVK